MANMLRKSKTLKWEACACSQCKRPDRRKARKRRQARKREEAEWRAEGGV